MEQDTAYDTDELEVDDRTALDRFAEVFVSPRSAFTGLQTARKGSIIAIGLVITALIASASALVLMLNPTLSEAALEKRTEVIEKARDEGRMTDKQYEQQMEAMNIMSPGMMATVSAISAAIFSPLFSLLLGLIALVIIKVIQRDNAAEVGFGDALSVVLIAGMISLTGAIVSIAIKMITGKLEMDVSAAAFVNTDNMILSFFLNLLNPFTVWYLVVVGIGTAVVARSESAKAIAIWTGVWIVGGGLLAAGAQALSGIFG